MASQPDDKDVIYVPLAGTRSQSIQRLQIGLAGLGAMALLVGLATVIKDRAAQTDAAAVPEAAGSTAAESSPTANDPLADAGVAPTVDSDKQTTTAPRGEPSPGQ